MSAYTLTTRLFASSTTLVNSMPGESNTRSKAAVERIGSGAAVGVAVRYDHLRERGDLIEAEHAIQVVVDYAG